MSRPRAIAGQAILAVALLVILLQTAVWILRGRWYAVTFLYLLKPVLGKMGWGAWLLFPQDSFAMHDVVTTVLGLPVGLTLFAVGAVFMGFQGRG